MDDIQREIEQTERRVRRRWCEDGLPETFMGVFMLLLGGYFLGLGFLPTGTFNTLVLSLGPFVLVGLGVLVNRFVRLAKDRYVYPRTGYVAFRRGPSQMWRSAALGGAMGFVFAVAGVVTRRVPGVVSPLPAIYGVVGGALFIYMARRMRTDRFTVEGVIIAVSGLGLSFARITSDLAMSLFLCDIGLVFATGGLVAFRAFLKNTRPAEEQ
jgi:hypothetical protein